MASHGATPVARSLVVMVLGALLGMGVPAAAAAQPGLVTSEPRDRAVLAVAPGGVLLTFTAPPVLAESHVTVVDATGVEMTAGPPRVAAGNALWQPIALDSPGDVAAAYHVVLDSGGEASGVLRFSVGTGAPPGGPDSLPVAIPDDLHVHTIDPLSAFLLVVNGIVVIWVVVLLRLRRPTEPAPGTPSQ